ISLVKYQMKRYDSWYEVILLNKRLGINPDIVMIVYIVLFILNAATVQAVLDFDVRLSGELAPQGQGRVQVFKKNWWQRVCNFEWDRNDAKVICRQLGYDPERSETPQYKSDRVRDRMNYKWGREQGGRIYGIHNVNCTGNETYIGQCKIGKWHFRDPKCRRNHDAVAICKKDESDRMIRVKPTGVIELKHDGVWGMVCLFYHWSFARKKALSNVICKQLGFDFGLPTYKVQGINYRFPVSIYNILCKGTEKNLQECEIFHKVDENDCRYGLLTIECEPKFRLYQEMNMPSGIKSGVLMVHISDTWYAVGSPNLAYRGCKWLGLKTLYARTLGTVQLNTSSIAGKTVANMLCESDELSQCLKITLTAPSPGDLRSPALRYVTACPDKPDKAVSEAVIRLNESSHGNLEVFVNDTWYLVCHFNG
ncbi:unnamed protein product, partial [Owenia fusiformis]